MSEGTGHKTWYGLGIDNTGLRADADKSIGIFNDIGSKAQAQGTRIDSVFKKIGAGIAGMFATTTLASLISNIAKVRSEFEQLEISFTTMLGSRAKANALMQQAITTAAKTPFDLSGVATGYKQLLAYGIALEKVDSTLKMVGDVASGVSAPLGDIVYLYGTLNASGRVALMDIRQFAGRGIPIYEELAKVLGVAKDQINDLASTGRIQFEHVEKAFQNMTSEGGRFNNLMEAQSKSIGGMQSNLSDAIDQAKNDLGKKLEPALKSAITSATGMVENYESIGKTLIGLTASIGAYKATLVAISVVEANRRKIIAMINGMAKVQMTLNKAITKSEAVQIVQKELLTKAIIKQTAAQIKSNIAAMANPYVIAAAAVAGLTFAIYKLATAEDGAALAAEALAATREKLGEQMDAERSKTEQMLTQLKDETQTRTQRQKILADLQSKYPTLFKNLDIESAKYLNVAESMKQVNLQLQNMGQLQISTKIAEAESILKRLQSGVTSFGERQDAAKLLGVGFWERQVTSGMAFIEGVQKYIAGLKDQQDEEKLAAYNAISNEELRARKIRERNAEQEKYNALEEKSKTTALSFAEIYEKNTAEQNVARLNAEIKTFKTDVKDIARDFSFWEKELENANNQLKALNDKSTDQEWKDARARVAKAQTEVDRYSSKKSTGTKESQKADPFIFDVQRSTGLEEMKKQAKATTDAMRKANLDAVKQQSQDEESARIEYLIKWGNFEQKKLALIDKYQKEATAAKTGAAKDDLFKQLQQDLKALTFEELSGGSLDKLFQDASRLSTDTLKKVIEQGENRKKLGGLTPEQIKAIDEGIIDKTKELESRNPFIALKNGFEDLTAALAGDDKDKMQEAMDVIENAVQNTVATLSEIGGAVGDIFSAFGNDEVGQTIGNITGIVSGVGQAGVGVGKLMSGDVIGGIKDLTKGVAEVVKNITAIGDAKREKAILDMQDRIDALGESYDKLSDAIGKAYGQDAAKMIQQQNVMLKQQQILIQQQIKQEEAKKKTDKAKIKEWQKTYDDLNRQIEENKVKATDAIFGEDINSAIESFADAYASAWAAGDDKAKASKDIAKKMIKSMIVEAMKADIGDSFMANVRAKMEQFMASGGAIDATEQSIIDGMVQEMTSQLDNKYSWADKYMKDGSQSQGAASTGAVEKITHEDAGQLIGTLNGIQMEGIKQTGILFIMSEKSTRMIAETAELRNTFIEVRDLSLLSIGHLEKIAKNTNELYQINERLEKIEKNTSRI